MVHRGPRRLRAAFRFLRPPPPRSPALQNARLPPAGAPPPAGPAPLHLRAALPGPGDRRLAGRTGARRPQARGGRRRACGRAPRRRGRGRGRASAGRGARRPPRRTCPTWKTQIPVSNTWETFGPQHRACVPDPPPPPPPPWAPPPPHSCPSTTPPPGGVGLSVTFARAGVAGARGGGRGANFTRSFALVGGARRAALHAHRGTRGSR